MSKPDFDKIARLTACPFVPRCTGDTGYGPGGDGARYHSQKCDALTKDIRAALEDAYNAALEDACNETTNSHVKAAVRALKIVKEG